MTLRRLRWWDLAAAADIEREHFGADGWSQPAFWSELAQYDARYYLAAGSLEGGLDGYGGLAVAGREGFVQTLAVRPERAGQGLGAALLAALLAEAGRRGARQVLLEVRVDNDRAQALYRRHGFTEVGRRRGYYQPSGTDALVMRRG